jgi:hypothetical protein
MTETEMMHYRTGWNDCQYGLTPAGGPDPERFARRTLKIIKSMRWHGRHEGVHLVERAYQRGAINCCLVYLNTGQVPGRAE